VEPLGILQFLQSLLSPAPNTANETKEENSSQREEKTPDTQNDTAPSEQNRSAQDAVLRFLDAHERRANKFRK
jgi:hypothetical protein